MRVYSCGGAGTNVGKQIKDLDIDLCFIDTSISNLKGVSSDQIFLVEGMDGAGKDRSVTHKHFKNYASDILIHFAPSDDLNVVVSSLAGGSGSIVGPMIVKELLAAGKNVIVIGIESTHSIKELDNTIKTILTYKSISEKANKSIAFKYVENHSRREADHECLRFISLLALLVDKNATEEFDVSDLSNFINFDRVTENSPTVAVLEVNNNLEPMLDKNTVVVSSILVTTSSESRVEHVTPEYLSTCIVTDPSYGNDDLRIDNLLGRLQIILSSLQDQIKKHQDNKKVNKFNDVKVEASTDDGLVL